MSRQGPYLMLYKYLSSMARGHYYLFHLHWQINFDNLVNWASSQEDLILLHSNNKGADQPVLPHSLISAFDIHSLKRIIAKQCDFHLEKTLISISLISLIRVFAVRWKFQSLDPYQPNERTAKIHLAET